MHQQALWADGAAQAGRGGAPGDGTDLAAVTFVVVDLETTGGTPQDCGITEIGAVKVRGGEVLGEFQSLVSPGGSVPAAIAALTGITDRMLSTAPPLASVLPAFLEFARGAVLVAHNAGYDTGYLKAACARTGRPWPGVPVVDTVRLARHAVPREEVRDHKLATLARHFGSPVTPVHRALADARATVHVLHCLLGRIGSLGVHTLGDLRAFSSRVPESTRRKRHLADGLPGGPGVYLFRDARDRVLYVGTSVDVRRRVRAYFTAGETRRRMTEMVALAARVTAVPCATTLEANVRELRLIAEHAPPYNRRSRHPERMPWVKLTVEPFPRLAVVRDVRDDGGAYLGPFRTAEQATLAVAAIQEAFPVRRCTPRLPRRPAPGATACLLAELGRCPAPCVGGIDVAGYAALAAEVRAAITTSGDSVIAAALLRTGSLAQQQRYEEAAVHRDRLLAFLRGAARGQRLAPLARSPHLLGARRRDHGGWELVLVRHGRLAGTSVSPPGADPMPYVAALRASGEVVTPPPPPRPAAHPEETELLLRWLERPGVRLVELDGEWSSPVRGAVGARSRLDAPSADRLPGPVRAGGPPRPRLGGGPSGRSTGGRS